MADPSPIRLLLIEDSDIDAMFVTRLLQSNPKVDFEIDHATTLADALVLLREIEFDASLVDLHLPDAVELEAFEQIRALDARIPIVVFTGSDDENLALRAIESGAQDVMAKGHVTGQMLFRAVRFAIARQLKVMGFKADADTDPLTGMPNRRHLESQFVELHAIAQQKDEAMTLALFDVDHFKLVNDEHGHFIGDAVLVFFGDPETKGEVEDAMRCVEMALKMQERVATLQGYWKKNGVPNNLQVRMGIATGYCTVGNFGSDQRLDYTVLGSPVNLAARLQGLAAPDSILADQNTLSLIGDNVKSEPKGDFVPKGFARAVRYYEISQLADAARERERQEFSHHGEHVEVNVLDGSDIRAAIEELAEIQKRFEKRLNQPDSDE